MAAAVAPLPPQNLDAEESVIGAMLLSSAAIELVQREVDAGDFYRGSHARIYRAALTLHQLGQPVDAITVADHLDQQGLLDDIGGKQRVHELAALVPATSNAAHYARIVREMATLRGLTAVGEQIQRLGWERPGETTGLLEQARQLVDELTAHRVTSAMPLDGLTHHQVLELELPAERYLIDDLIPAGAVGTIAAVPEAHKSWLAQAIAVRISRGSGYVLGKQILTQGPVGYAWQDDSTREEAERVKAFEHAHPTGVDGTTDVIWMLNQGIQLPRDIARLRATVEHHKLVLLILDSYYNFLPGVDLKDEQAEQIVSLLKREISDATGATVLIVDHMPWATEQNRQRLRAYGGVFKNAATRFGIYIDATGDKLHLEARGNNIRGIQRRLAYWDADTLELKLVNTEELEDGEFLDARADDVRAWLEANPGFHSKRTIRAAIKGKTALADHALEQLLLTGHVIDVTRLGSHTLPGVPKRGWIASIHAEKYGIVNVTPLEGHDWVTGSRSGETGHETGHPDHERDPAQGSHPGHGVTHRDPSASEERDPRAALPPKGGSPEGHTPTATPPATVTPPGTRTLAEQWIDQEGWMHPDPAFELLHRYPTLSTYDITALLSRASSRAAEEAGDTSASDEASRSEEDSRLAE